MMPVSFKHVGYGIIAGLVGMAGGAWLERTYRPPEVKVQEKLVKADKEVVVKTVEGPVRIETKTVTKTVPGPERPGPTIERVVTRVETRDPIIIDRATRTDTETATISIEKPLPEPAQWAFGAGLQTGVEVQVSLSRRLFGPFWLTGWVNQPTELKPPASAGLGLRVEF